MHRILAPTFSSFISASDTKTKDIREFRFGDCFQDESLNESLGVWIPRRDERTGNLSLYGIKKLFSGYKLGDRGFGNTEPSYSNESYDSVSCKPLDGFQNALHNKHIYVFGEVLITKMSLNITIYSTL